jgi:hypothetical protein
MGDTKEKPLPKKDPPAKKVDPPPKKVDNPTKKVESLSKKTDKSTGTLSTIGSTVDKNKTKAALKAFEYVRIPKLPAAAAGSDNTPQGDEQMDHTGDEEAHGLLPLNVENVLPEDSYRSPLEEGRYFRRSAYDHAPSREDESYYDNWEPRGRGRGRWGPWDNYSCPPTNWGPGPGSRDPYYDYPPWGSHPDSSWYGSAPPGYADLDDPRHNTGEMDSDDRRGDYDDTRENVPEENEEGPEAPDDEDTGNAPSNDDAALVEQTAGPVPESEEDYLKSHKGNYAPETGPALSVALTSHLNTIWQRGRDPALMKRFYETHPKPEGTPFEKVDLNSDITTLLNADPQKKHVVTRDLRFKGIQTLVAKAAIPAAKVCQMIMTGQSDKQAMVDACLDSITALANASSQTNQMRRDNLRPYINKQISGLVCKQRKENDLSADLFPKMQESAQAAKQGVGLLNIGRGRGGGGRGRGGRYRPYPTRGFRGYRGPWRGPPGRYDSYYSIAHGSTTPVTLDSVAPNDIPNTIDPNHYHTDDMNELLANTCDISSGEMNSLVNNVLTVDCSREGSVSVEQQWSAERDGIRRSRTRGQERPVVDTQDEVSHYVAQFTSKWDTFQACRVKQCMSRWRSVTSDPWILKNLYGYKLELINTPVQDRPIPEIRFNKKEKDIMQQEVDKFIDKGILVFSEHEPEEFVSNVFLRPKKDPGAFRMIFNLTQLNTFVEYQHFKMETLDTALKLVTRGAWMGSLDFTDAYYTLPVYPDHQKYLKFTFAGQLYKFVAVPMGLSSACRYFTKIMKVPLSVLRERHNVAIAGYIDDTFLADTSPETCGKALEVAAELFQELGFMISASKSVFQPTTKIEYLGFIIDSISMTVVPTREKITKLRKAANNLLAKQSTSIRHLAQVEGGLLATHPGNPWAPLFTKQMEIDKLQALACNRFDFDAFMWISDTVKSDLTWWLENLGHTKAHIGEQYPDFVIHTDASLQGYGFFVPESGIQAGSRWGAEESDYHINVLELLAIDYSLKATVADRHDIHVRIMCDNTTAIAGIRKQGSTRTIAINQIARALWLWALERRIWLSAVHIPGIENVEADEASRVFQDELEWTLNDFWFQKICKTFGIPTMDLFASRLNFKAKIFCSF